MWAHSQNICVALELWNSDLSTLSLQQSISYSLGFPTPPALSRLWFQQRFLLWFPHKFLVVGFYSVSCYSLYPACLSLQFWGQHVALWPLFSDGSKKNYWFSSLLSFFLVWKSVGFQAPYIPDWKPEVPFIHLCFPKNLLNSACFIFFITCSKIFLLDALNEACITCSLDGYLYLNSYCLFLLH